MYGCAYFAQGEVSSGIVENVHRWEKLLKAEWFIKLHVHDAIRAMSAKQAGIC